MALIVTARRGGTRIFPIGGEDLSAGGTVGSLDILLGGAGEIKQGGERRKDGMTVDASDARGGVGEVDKGGQGWRMFAAAVLTDGGRRTGEDELGAGRCRRRLAAQTTGIIRRVGLALEEQMRHGSQPCLESDPSRWAL